MNEERITKGTRVVCVHPKHPASGAHWGTVERFRYGTVAKAYVRFDHMRDPVALVPLEHLLAPGPTPYPNDGIGDHYWRKDCEVEAERLVFRADPANDGKTFWPKTYID